MRHAFTRAAAFGNLGNPVLCRNFVLKMGQLACLGEMECIDQLRDWKQPHARAHSSLSIRHLESHNGDIERSLFTPAGAAFFELLRPWRPKTKVADFVTETFRPPFLLPNTLGIER